MPDTIFGADPITVLVFSAVSGGFLLVLLTAAGYATLFERKVISRLQVRVGPNRAGPFGVLQPLADFVKLVFKEDTRPSSADRVLHRLAPMFSVFAALAAFAVVPLFPEVEIFGVAVSAVADLDVGVLYLLGVSSLSVYGLVLGGWSSGSKYSLLGALRGAAQFVSYEVVLGLAIASVVIVTGEMSLGGIVEWQQQTRVPILLVQPLGFGLFVIGMFAETNRAPFDLPEADTELVSGFSTEYSGFRWGLFMMAEYAAMVSISAVAATLYLGGWAGPFGLLPGPWWMALYVAGFLFLFVWVRATVPRLRYDQLMQLSWRTLVPLGLLNVLCTAIVVVIFAA